MQLKPALAVNLKDYDAKILVGKTWRISEKIDGVRRLFYKSRTGLVSCYSRSGKQDRWLTHITDYLASPWFPSDYVYDCEVVDRELYFAKVESFIMRSVSAGKAGQQYPNNKKDLMAICFDIYRPGDATDGFGRNDLLNSLFGQVALSDPIIIVPVYGVMEGADTSILNAMMKQVESIGGEGLMLMNMSSIYMPGRSKELVKVKRMEEFTGTVVDIEMARDGTKIEGGIAALICEVPGCTVPVRVGTGFSHELRHELAAMDIIGRVVEIDAFSRTRDKKGNISLSMPVFKDFASKS